MKSRDVLCGVVGFCLASGLWTGAIAARDRLREALPTPAPVYRLTPTQATIGTLLKASGWPLSAQEEAELRAFQAGER